MIPKSLRKKGLPITHEVALAYVEKDKYVALYALFRMDTGQNLFLTRFEKTNDPNDVEKMVDMELDRMYTANQLGRLAGKCGRIRVLVHDRNLDLQFTRRYEVEEYEQKENSNS
jgi:hypothetical protein